MSVLRSEPIDARRENGLDRRRHLDRVDWLHQAVSSGLAGQDLRLHQGPDCLLEEEWVTASHEELLERRQPRIPAEEGVQQLPGALGR